jgi:hypothetical protein
MDRLDAGSAANSRIPLKSYLKGKLIQLSEKARLRVSAADSIRIGGDGEIEIRDNPSAEEMVSVNGTHSPYDPYLGEKCGELAIEIGNLDRSIREGQERLERLRDEEQAATEQAKPRATLMREWLISFVCFIVISAGEIGALIYVLSDWFGVDSSQLLTELRRNTLGVILLIPVAIGLFSLLLLIASKLIQAQREGKFLERALYFIILLVTGIGLGAMRAFQVTRGEINRGVMLISVMVTTGVPIVAAVIKSWWRQTALELDQVRQPLTTFRREIRKSVADLRELRRLRRNAERKREEFERHLQVQEDTEAASIRWVAARLSQYKEAYLKASGGIR